MVQDVTGREYENLTPAQQAEIAEVQRPHRDRFQDALKELAERAANGHAPTGDLVGRFQRLFDELVGVRAESGPVQLIAGNTSAAVGATG